MDWNVEDIPTVALNDHDVAATKTSVAPGSRGVKRTASSVEAVNGTSQSKKKSQDSAGNVDNLATILTGQKSSAAIPQSLALLQSRYLVGNKPGLSVIGSDSQQATVLLLANKNLMPRQNKNDAISLMLA